MSDTKWRITEKKVGAEWVPFAFEDLRPGDIARIYDEGSADKREYRIDSIPAPEDPPGNYGVLVTQLGETNDMPA